MNKLLIQCDYTILDNYKYKILKDNQPYLNAEVDFYSPVVSFLKGNKIYYSKISVKDLEEKEVVEIYKHHQGPIRDTLFSIILDNITYNVREGRNFKIPDLYIRTNLGKLVIWGKINSQEFEIFLNGEPVASIKGSVKSTKTYILNYLEDYSSLEKLFLSIALILDNLYHDY
ncbi:hypothetical protein [Peptoniphilus catoniae]|uniref:hypothetical protein n=1 Tax=Peptoniphilus catoniae TaxID=1660341 RepID=UPI0010FEED8F|nr:hypothetical protein [Peptoniphilus catoniae]